MGRKRYKFHLNTSTTCFLCFNEIPKFDSDDIKFNGGQDQDKTSNSEIPKAVESNPYKAVSLTTILNYLKIDLKQIKSFSSKSKSLINKTDIRVTLCSECGVAVENFSELYKALELIVMKLEYSSERIERKLKTNPALLDIYKSKIKECLDGQPQKHLIVVEEIRHKISFNCNVITPKYQPKVKLKRLKVQLHQQQKANITHPSSFIKEEPALGVPEMAQNFEQSMYAGTFGSDFDDASFNLQEESADEAEAETGSSDTEEASLKDSFPPSPIKISRTVKQSVCNLNRQYQNVNFRKRYKCKFCRNRYTLKGHLTFHQKTCKQTLPTRLAKINAQKHDPRWKFTCGTCNKRFIQKGDINRHIRTVHLNERDHACNICEKTFKYVDSLKEHQQSVHLGIKFCCKICNKPFDSKGGLRHHEVKCTNKRIKTEMK